MNRQWLTPRRATTQAADVRQDRQTPTFITFADESIIFSSHGEPERRLHNFSMGSVAAGDPLDHRAGVTNISCLFNRVRMRAGFSSSPCQNLPSILTVGEKFLLRHLVEGSI